MNKNISHKVRALCSKKHMTMKDLADKIGIAPESLSRAINGNPRLSTICKIADALDVSVAELFAHTGDELLAIVVCDGETYIATTKQELKAIVNSL